MIINRETDYALRILRELMDGENHSLVEMCEKEDLPQAFAYKIIKKLEKSGLINITRGVRGGCRAAVDFSEVSLYDLVWIMSQEKNISPCINPDYVCSWKTKNGICNIHCNLSKIQKKIDEEMRKHSIEKIVMDTE